MKRPEDALAAARERGAKARGRGEYAGGGGRYAGGDGDPLEPERLGANRQLARWAIVEPDRAQVYSTRRWGAPVTALKRLLIRLLGQYLDQVIAQQSRFNAHAAAYMLALEDRVRVLEQARERDGRDPGTPAAPPVRPGPSDDR
jgi:hypothetical protein